MSANNSHRDASTANQASAHNGNQGDHKDEQTANTDRTTPSTGAGQPRVHPMGRRTIC